MQRTRTASAHNNCKHTAPKLQPRNSAPSCARNSSPPPAFKFFGQYRHFAALLLLLATFTVNALWADGVAAQTGDPQVRVQAISPPVLAQIEDNLLTYNLAVTLETVNGAALPANRYALGLMVENPNPAFIIISTDILQRTMGTRLVVETTAVVEVLQLSSPIIQDFMITGLPSSATFRALFPVPGQLVCNALQVSDSDCSLFARLTNNAYPWQTTRNVTFSGNAMHSAPNLPHGQSSELEIEFEAGATIVGVEFYRRVDSERLGDWLIFEYNNADRGAGQFSSVFYRQTFFFDSDSTPVQGDISGNAIDGYVFGDATDASATVSATGADSGWSQLQLATARGSPISRLRFIYRKNAALSEGEDSGWITRLNFYPAFTSLAHICEVLDIEQNCPIVNAILAFAPWLVDEGSSPGSTGNTLMRSPLRVVPGLESCFYVYFETLPDGSRLEFQSRLSDPGDSLRVLFRRDNPVVDEVELTPSGEWQIMQYYVNQAVNNVGWCFQRNAGASNFNGFVAVDELRVYTGAEATRIHDNQALCAALDLDDCSQISSFSHTATALAWQLTGSQRLSGNAALTIPANLPGGENTCLETEIEIAGRQTLAFNWRLNAVAGNTLSFRVNGSERQSLRGTGTDSNWQPVVIHSSDPISSISWCFASADGSGTMPQAWVDGLSTGIAVLGADLSAPIPTTATETEQSYQFALTLSDPTGTPLPAELNFELPTQLDGARASFTAEPRPDGTTAANKRVFDITSSLLLSHATALISQIQLQLSTDLIDDYRLVTDSTLSLSFNLFERTRMRFCEAMALAEASCELITGIESNEFPWQFTSTGTFSGSAVQSFPGLGAERYSQLTLTLAAGVRAVSFYRRVSSFRRLDWLIFEYNEISRGSELISEPVYQGLPFFDGEGNRTQGDISGRFLGDGVPDNYAFGNFLDATDSVDLGSGGRYSLLQAFSDEDIGTLRWIYRKSSALSEGEDRGWIDNLRLSATRAQTRPRAGAELCEALNMSAQDCVRISTVTTTAERPWVIAGLGFELDGNYLHSAFDFGDESTRGADAGSCLTLQLSPVLPAATRIDFAWRVTGDSQDNGARFSINNTRAAQTSNTQQWHSQQRLSLEPVNSLSWCYRRGSDGAFPHHQLIDRLQFTSPAEAQPGRTALCRVLDLTDTGCQIIANFSHTPPTLPWRITTAQSVAGGSALQIPLTVLDGERSCINLNLTASIEPGTRFDFNWRIASAADTTLSFLINSSETATATLAGDGSDSSWQRYTHIAITQIDSFSWCYRNDSDTGAHSGQAWLDSLAFEPQFRIQAISSPTLTAVNETQLSYQFAFSITAPIGTSLPAELSFRFPAQLGGITTSFTVEPRTDDPDAANQRTFDITVELLPGAALISQVQLRFSTDTIADVRLSNTDLPILSFSLFEHTRLRFCLAMEMTYRECLLITGIASNEFPWQFTDSGTFSGTGLQSDPELMNDRVDDYDLPFSQLTLTLAPGVQAVSFYRRVDSNLRTHPLFVEYNQFERGTSLSQQQIDDGFNPYTFPSPSYQMLPFFDGDGNMVRGDITGSGSTYSVRTNFGPNGNYSLLQLFAGESIRELRWIYADPLPTFLVNRGWIDNLRLSAGSAEPPPSVGTALCETLNMSQSDCARISSVTTTAARPWFIADLGIELDGNYLRSAFDFGEESTRSADATSCLTLHLSPALPAATRIDFAWRVTSGATEDGARFSINNTLAAQTSNTQQWHSQQRLSQEPVNSLSWCYQRGSDGAFPHHQLIDRLQFTPPMEAQPRQTALCQTLDIPDTDCQTIANFSHTPPTLHWRVTTTQSRVGDSALQIPLTVLDGERSCLTFNLTTSIEPGASLNFGWRIATAADTAISFLVGDSETATLASDGNDSGWQLFTHTAVAAINSLSWCYHNDADTGANPGLAWLDSLAFGPQLRIQAISTPTLVQTEQNRLTWHFELTLENLNGPAPAANRYPLNFEISAHSADHTIRASSVRSQRNEDSGLILTVAVELELITLAPTISWQDFNIIGLPSTPHNLPPIELSPPLVSIVCRVLELSASDCALILAVESNNYPWQISRENSLSPLALSSDPNLPPEASSRLILRLSPAVAAVEFYRRVSSELNNDYLIFEYNEVRRGRVSALSGFGSASLPSYQQLPFFDSDGNSRVHGDLSGNEADGYTFGDLTISPRERIDANPTVRFGTDSSWSQLRLLADTQLSLSELRWIFDRESISGNPAAGAENLSWLARLELHPAITTATELCRALDLEPENCLITAVTEQPVERPWIVDDSTALIAVGGTALRSPLRLSAGETACLNAHIDEGVLPAASRIDFEWRMDTRGGESFRFFINGIETAVLTQATDWQSQQHFATAAVTELSWCFSSSQASASSVGFGAVEQLSLLPSPATTATLCATLDLDDCNQITSVDQTLTLRPWQFTATESLTGATALAIPSNLPDGGSACLEVDVEITGRQTLAFSWRLATAAGSTLSFLVNGSQVQELAGTDMDTLWQPVSIFSPDPISSISWCYTTDGNSESPPRGWVDALSTDLAVINLQLLSGPTLMEAEATDTQASYQFELSISDPTGNPLPAELDLPLPVELDGFNTSYTVNSQMQGATAAQLLYRITARVLLPDGNLIPQQRLLQLQFPETIANYRLLTDTLRSLGFNLFQHTRLRFCRAMEMADRECQLITAIESSPFPWQFTSQSTFSGRGLISAADLERGQQSQLTLTLAPGVEAVSFYRRVSSLIGFEWLTFEYNEISRGANPASPQAYRDLPFYDPAGNRIHGDISGDSGQFEYGDSTDATAAVNLGPNGNYSQLQVFSGESIRELRWIFNRTIEFQVTQHRGWIDSLRLAAPNTENLPSVSAESAELCEVLNMRQQDCERISTVTTTAEQPWAISSLGAQFDGDYLRSTFTGERTQTGASSCLTLQLSPPLAMATRIDFAWRNISGTPGDGANFLINDTLVAQTSNTLQWHSQQRFSEEPVNSLSWCHQRYSVSIFPHHQRIDRLRFTAPTAVPGQTELCEALDLPSTDCPALSLSQTPAALQWRITSAQSVAGGSALQIPLSMLQDERSCLELTPSIAAGESFRFAWRIASQSNTALSLLINGNETAIIRGDGNDSGWQFFSHTAAAAIDSLSWCYSAGAQAVDLSGRAWLDNLTVGMLARIQTVSTPVLVQTEQNLLTYHFELTLENLDGTPLPAGNYGLFIVNPSADHLIRESSVHAQRADGNRRILSAGVELELLNLVPTITWQEIIVTGLLSTATDMLTLEAPFKSLLCSALELGSADCNLIDSVENGAYPWQLTRADTFAFLGLRSAPDLPDNTSSTLTIHLSSTVAGLQFYRRVSSEAAGDWLIFEYNELRRGSGQFSDAPYRQLPFFDHDGTPVQGDLSGTPGSYRFGDDSDAGSSVSLEPDSAWSQLSLLPDTPIFITALRWIYRKNASDSAGQDRAWIDTLSISPVVPRALASIAEISTPTLVPSTDNNAEFRFVITLDDASMLPTVVLPQLQLSADLPLRLITASNRVVTTNTGPDGGRQFVYTVTASLDIPLFREASLGISFTSTLAVIEPARIPLPTAAFHQQRLCSILQLSANHCALIETLSSSADFPWQIVETAPGSGGEALASATGLPDDEQSCLTLTLTDNILVAGSRIDFIWVVDSAAGDNLQFAINDVDSASISGSVVPTHQQQLFSSAAVSTLSWCFSKNGAGSAGQDRGWLQQLDFSTPVTTVARFCEVLDMSQSDCERVQSFTISGGPWNSINSPELGSEVLQPVPSDPGDVNTCLSLQLSEPLTVFRQGQQDFRSRIDMLWQVPIGSNPSTFIFQNARASATLALDTGTDGFFPQQRFLSNESDLFQWCYARRAGNADNPGESVQIDQLRFIDAAEASLISDTEALCRVLDVAPDICAAVFTSFSQQPPTLSWQPDISETRTGDSSLRLPSTVLSREQSCIMLQAGQLVSPVLEFDWRIDAASSSRLEFRLNDLVVGTLRSDGSDSGWLTYSTTTLNIVGRQTNTLSWCYIHSTLRNSGRHSGWVDSLGFGTPPGISAITNPALQRISSFTGTYQFEVTISIPDESTTIEESQLQRLGIELLGHSDNISIGTSTVSARRLVNPFTAVLTVQLPVELLSFQAPASLRVGITGVLSFTDVSTDTRFDVSELFIPTFCRALKLRADHCQLLIRIDSAAQVPWQIVDSTDGSGKVLQSHVDLADSPLQNSTLSVTVSPQVEGVEFDWRVSSAAEDSLIFLANGMELSRISGTTAMNARPENFQGLENSGASRLQWIFAQTSNTPAGDNRGWLEQLTLRTRGARISAISTPQATALLGGYQFSVTAVHPDGVSAVSDSESLTISDTANLRVHSIDSTTVGTMREFTVTLVLLRPTDSGSLDVNFLDNVVVEPTRTVSFAAWSISDTLCAALDLSTGDCAVISSFSTSADYPWQMVETDFQNGDNLLASAAALPDDESSCLRLEFAPAGTAVGRVDFTWAVDSAPGDNLQLWNNNQLLAINSGLLATAPYERQQRLLATNPTALSWCYSKNSAGSTGTDRGWLDNMSFRLAPDAALLPATKESLCEVLDLDDNSCDLIREFRQEHTGNSTNGLSWAATIMQSVAGSSSLRSPLTVAETASSCLVLQPTSALVAGTELRFQWQVDSAPDTDFLRFNIDNMEISSISGPLASNPWREVRHTLTEASTELAWCFDDTAAASAGASTGWIDQLQLLLPLPQFSIAAVTTVTLQQTLGRYQFTVVAQDNNQGFGSAELLQQLLLTTTSHRNIAAYTVTSTLSDSGDKLFMVTVQLQAADSTGSILVALSHPDPTLLAAADTSRTIVLAAPTAEQSICMPLDLSTEGCALIRGFDTSTDYPWQIAEADFGNGDNLLASAARIPDNESSCLTLEFELGGTPVGRVDFTWAVDSDSGDNLQLWNNNQLLAINSGLLSTAPHERQQRLLATNPIALSWCYSKNAAGSAGADRGWLDSLSFITGTVRGEQGTVLDTDKQDLCTALDLDDDGCELISEFIQEHSGSNTEGLSWAVTEMQSIMGVSSLRSPLTVPENSTSCLTLQPRSAFVAGTELRFQWRVDSTTNTDFLQFNIDDMEISRISGPLTANPWTEVRHTLGQASNKLSWCFADTGPASAGASTGWIDQLQLLLPLPQFNIAAVTTITLQQTLGRYQFTVVARNTREEAAEAAASAIGQLVLSTTEHRNITTYTVTSSLADNGDKLFVLTIQLQAVDSPASISLALSHNDPTLLAAADTTRTISLAAPTAEQSICMPLNLSTEDCALIEGFSTSADYPWQIAETQGGSGEALLASAAAVADDSQSCLTLTLTADTLVANSRIDFSWAVDSASGDNLQLAINEVDIASISGSSIPTHRQQRFSTTTVSVLSWCFSKDSAGSAGQDRGWLDQLSFQLPTAATLLPNKQALCDALDLSTADCAAINAYTQSPDSLSWGVTTDNAQLGSSSLQSPATVTDGESSCLQLQTDLPAGTTIDFAWRVDSAADSALSLQVNGTAVADISISGALADATGDGWQPQRYTHATAISSLGWCYERGAMFAGIERGWLDQLRLEPAFNYPPITLQTEPTQAEADGPWTFSLRVSVASGETALPVELELTLTEQSNLNSVMIAVAAQSAQTIDLDIEAVVEDDNDIAMISFGLSGLPAAVEPLTDGLTVVIRASALSQVIPLLQALTDEDGLPADDRINVNDLLLGLNLVAGNNGSALNLNLQGTNSNFNDDMMAFISILDNPRLREALDVDDNNTVNTIDFRLMLRYQAGLRGAALCDEVCRIKLESLLEE